MNKEIGEITTKECRVGGVLIEDNDSFYHDEFYDTVIGFDHKGDIPKAQGNEKTIVEWEGRKYHLIKEDREGDFHKLFMRTLVEG